VQHADHAEEEEVLAPDEAPTPMWLPLIGGALLLLAIIFVAASGPSEGAAAREGASGSDQDNPAAAPSDAPSADNP
jgi:hypothetical protein